MMKALTVIGATLSVVLLVVAGVLPALIGAVGLAGLGLGLGLVWWLTDISLGIARPAKAAAAREPTPERHPKVVIRGAAPAGSRTPPPAARS